MPSFSQDIDGMDLEMLAPYISMDDDFQLTFLSSLPEEGDNPPPSSPELSATVSRKRYDRPIDLNTLRMLWRIEMKMCPDEDVNFVLMVAPEDTSWWPSQNGLLLCAVDTPGNVRANHTHWYPGSLVQYIKGWFQPQLRFGLIVTSTTYLLLP